MKRNSVGWAARNEITEYLIYKKVITRVKNPKNRKLLEEIAEQEKSHYDYWCQELGRKVEPSRFRFWFYTTITRILGLSFGLKLMEKGEILSQAFYRQLGKTKPEALKMIEDEQKHEEQLLNLIDEKHLKYVSSFVLGLNDALVELTGALAGLTLALQNTKLIAIVGFITGMAASMAMAASEYLSSREEAGKNAIQAGIITGIAYFFTVLFLIAPYFLLNNPFLALIGTLSMAVVIIFLFTFYTSVAKGLSFKKRFVEMALISFGVAGFSFGLGYAIRHYFGV